MTRGTRLQTQSNPPSDDSGQDDCGGEISGECVVACCDAPPVLEMAERPFDHIAASVSGPIERVELLSGRVLFDLRGGAPIGQEGPERVAVIRGITQQSLRGRDFFHHALGGRQIVTVSLGQVEGDDAAKTIDDGVDFRGSPASASADSLVLSPPFPPAAQR